MQTFFLALPPDPPSFFFWVFWGCLEDPFVSFFGGCKTQAQTKLIYNVDNMIIGKNFFHVL